MLSFHSFCECITILKHHHKVSELISKHQQSGVRKWMANAFIAHLYFWIGLKLLCVKSCVHFCCCCFVPSFYSLLILIVKKSAFCGTRAIYAGLKKTTQVCFVVHNCTLPSYLHYLIRQTFIRIHPN